jgi:hypothetical protein
VRSCTRRTLAFDHSRTNEGYMRFKFLLVASLLATSALSAQSAR